MAGNKFDDQLPHLMINFNIFFSMPNFDSLWDYVIKHSQNDRPQM